MAGIPQYEHAGCLQHIHTTQSTQSCELLEDWNVTRRKIERSTSCHKTQEMTESIEGHTSGVDRGVIK